MNLKKQQKRLEHIISFAPQIPKDKSTTVESSYKINTYAVCYNIFRIMSGIGALAYSS